MITKDFMYCKYNVADRDELFDKLSTDLVKEGADTIESIGNNG